MKIEPEKTILFIGDSITDCGRSRPIGDNKTGLGNGYVSIIDALIEAVYPQKHIRVLNTGETGNRITDLQERWQSDALSLNSDWLSIMIGINDVWRQFDDPLNPVQVTKEQFRKVYEKLIQNTAASLDGLVLMTPFYLETNRKDPMRKLMDEYGEVVKNLAKKHGAIFVDVQKSFDQYLKHKPTQSLCWDRVHPNLAGHAIIAKSFLEAIAFKW